MRQVRRGRGGGGIDAVRVRGDGERAGAAAGAEGRPIQVTGPPAERLNLIVLGDGYQKDQQELFRKDVDRNLAVMWATEPFRTYRNYINVYAVELASIDYGVRCDPDGRKRSPDGTVRDTGEREGPIDGKRTALRMIFQNGCADPLSRGTVYGGAPVGCANDAAYYPAGVNPCETGTQAHNRILDTYVAPVLGIPRTSQNIQTLAIFNTFTYGGIGGSQATTSGGSPQGPLISLHEIGHSLGTLVDEYPYSSRDVVRACYTGGEPVVVPPHQAQRGRDARRRRRSGGAGSARRACPAARSAPTRAAARTRAARSARRSTR